MTRLTTTPAGRRVRPGRISVFLLLALPVLLLLILLARNTYFLAYARQTQQHGADTAALAGARGLVDDRWFQVRERSDCMPIFVAAFDAARRYAGLNTSLNNPLEVRSDDVVFGVFDRAARKFQPVNPWQPSVSLTELRRVNAVRVTVERTRRRGNAVPLLGGRFLSLRETDLVTPSTAYLDRDVMGFYARGAQIVPLAPVALLSDKGGKIDKLSWETQVERGSTGLMHVRLNLHPGKGKGKGDTARRSNALLLQLGTTQFEEIAQQLTDGMRSEQFARYHQENPANPGHPDELLLPAGGGHLRVPTWPARLTDFHVRRLQLALRQLQSRRIVLIFPLYSEPQSSAGVAALRDFVAARVVDVASAGDGGLEFTLQRAMLATGTAITGPAGAGVGSLRNNPYLCKIRLAE